MRLTLAEVVAVAADWESDFRFQAQASTRRATTGYLAWNLVSQSARTPSIPEAGIGPDPASSLDARAQQGPRPAGRRRGRKRRPRTRSPTSSRGRQIGARQIHAGEGDAPVPADSRGAGGRRGRRGGSSCLDARGARGPAAGGRR